MSSFQFSTLERNYERGNASNKHFGTWLVCKSGETKVCSECHGGQQTSLENVRIFDTVGYVCPAHFQIGFYGTKWCTWVTTHLDIKVVYSVIRWCTNCQE